MAYLANQHSTIRVETEIRGAKGEAGREVGTEW